MAENCTIYCKINNRDEIEQLLRTRYSALKISSPSRNKDSLILKGKKGSVRITFKIRIEPGDEFSRLILSTYTHVDSNMTGDEESKQFVVDHILASELILGVVVEPSFDADEDYDRVVFAIAASFDGIIFTGSEMLDADGEELVVTE